LIPQYAEPNPSGNFGSWFTAKSNRVISFVWMRTQNTTNYSSTPGNVNSSTTNEDLLDWQWVETSRTYLKPDFAPTNLTSWGTNFQTYMGMDVDTWNGYN
jgi:hypothetical protein